MYIILPLAAIDIVVPTIPAPPAEVAVYLPGRLGVVKKRS
jgi:hypothetical protein